MSARGFAPLVVVCVYCVRMIAGICGAERDRNTFGNRQRAEAQMVREFVLVGRIPRDGGVGLHKGQQRWLWLQRSSVRWPISVTMTAMAHLILAAPAPQPSALIRMRYKRHSRGQFDGPLSAPGATPPLGREKLATPSGNKPD